MQGAVEPRQTTSNVGHLNRPTIVAMAHGLNKNYYSIGINYRKNELEQKMLLNLNKVNWSDGLKNEDFEEQSKQNDETLKGLGSLAGTYNDWIQDEIKKPKEELVVTTVGKLNPKTHLQNDLEESLNSNITECLGSMMNSTLF